MTHKEPLTVSITTVWRGSDKGEPVSGTMLTPAPAEDGANMGSVYQLQHRHTPDTPDSEDLARAPMP